MKFNVIRKVKYQISLNQAKVLVRKIFKSHTRLFLFLGQVCLATIEHVLQPFSPRSGDGYQALVLLPYEYTKNKEKCIVNLILSPLESKLSYNETYKTHFVMI